MHWLSSAQSDQYSEFDLGYYLAARCDRDRSGVIPIAEYAYNDGCGLTGGSGRGIGTACDGTRCWAEHQRGADWNRFCCVGWCNCRDTALVAASTSSLSAGDE